MVFRVRFLENPLPVRSRDFRQNCVFFYPPGSLFFSFLPAWQVVLFTEIDPPLLVALRAGDRSFLVRCSCFCFTGPQFSMHASPE